MKDLNKKIDDIKISLIDVFGNEQGEKILQKTIIPNINFRLDSKLIKDDISSFRDLFLNIILPQSKQFYRDLLNQERETSEYYNEYLSTKQNEILQLAYVGLYHKMENYENQVVANFNIMNQKNYKGIDEIGIDRSKKELFSDRNRIRLICNCVKHNNGYPNKELLKYYPELDIEMRIGNEHLNFANDINLILTYIQFFNVFVSVKSFQESLDKIELPEFKELKSETLKFIEFLSVNESYIDPEYQRSYLND